MRWRADRVTGVVLVAACAALSACLTPVDPSRVPVAAVRVTIGEKGRTLDTLQVRGTGAVHAAAIASEGYDIGLSTFRYASANPAIAVVDSTGTVRGVSVGTTTITASLPDGKSGTATVVVVPSTIAYRIPLGGVPGAIAFSPDYSKAYVAVGGDSLAIIDALGFYRIGMIDVGQRIEGVASTGSTVYATHPDVDSVSVISAATKQLTGRMWVGAGPDGVAASGNRAYVATTYDRKVVIIDNGRLTFGIPMAGEPHLVAVSGTGARVFVTVNRGGTWYVVSADPAGPDTLASLALPGQPTAIAASRDGATVVVAIPSQQKVLELAVDDGGRMTVSHAASVSASARGVAIRSFGIPYVAVSGTPLMVMDGSLGNADELAGGGDGALALRPDGLFLFVGDRASNEIHVIGL